MEESSLGPAAPVPANSPIQISSLPAVSDVSSFFPPSCQVFPSGKIWYTEVGILVIYPDFSLDLTVFFPGKHLIQFIANKMQVLQNFVLHNCFLNFDAEQVYLKPQVTNVKNKEVTANPKPQTLEKH